MVSNWNPTLQKSAFHVLHLCFHHLRFSSLLVMCFMFAFKQQLAFVRLPVSSKVVTDESVLNAKIRDREREGVEGNTRPGRETSFSHYPQSVTRPSIFWPPCSKESLEFHELRAVCLFVRRTGLTVPLEQKARVLLVLQSPWRFCLASRWSWYDRLATDLSLSLSAGGSTEYSTIVPSQKIWLTSEKFIPATTVTKMVIIR